MDMIEIVAEGLTREQLSALEAAESNGSIILPSGTQLHEPGMTTTAIQCVVDNLPLLTILLVSWKLKIKVMRKKKDGTSTNIDIDLGNKAIDPKAAVALVTAAAKEGSLQ